MTTAPTTYIHLGLPKTATTTLQDHLFLHHPQIHYFGKASDGSHSPSVRSAILAKHVKTHSIDPDDIRSADLPLQLAHAAEHNLTPVLSREGLSGGPVRKKQEQAKRFQEYFGACKILLVIREPLSFMTSYYVQQLRNLQLNQQSHKPRWMKRIGKAPKYFDINRWMNVSWNCGASARNFLSTADTAETYAGVFGYENIHILMFEELIHHPDRFIERLCGILDVDAGQAKRLLENRRSNSRLPMVFVEQVKRMQRSPIRAARFRQASSEERFEMLIQGEGSYDPFKPQLSDRWRDIILKTGAEQNRRLLNQWNLPLADYGYQL